MIRAPLDVLREIRAGAALKYSVVVFFQQPETYTVDGRLISVGDISQSLSMDGMYEVQNTSITLKNDGYYFSRKFKKEMPNGALVVVYALIAETQVEIFRGTVADNWQITSTILTLNLTVTRLFDPINLRSSDVYRSPESIQPLYIAFGDLTSSRIPGLQIDKDGLIFHFSDRPMERITAVFADDQRVTSGFTAFPAYQDETGRAISAVVFSQPMAGKRISVSGKGVVDPDTGILIENPSAFMKYILINVQGYGAQSVDSAEVSRLYSECLAKDIKIAYLLQGEMTVKALFDELAQNLFGRWMLSDGRAIVRLNGPSDEAPVYDFEEEEIKTDFNISSGPLVNEASARFGWDFAADTPLASITKHNPLSKGIYGTFKKPVDLKMIQRTRDAERVCDAILATSSVPEVTASFKHNLKSILLEVGDPVSITHAAGLDDGGYSEAAAMVTQKQFRDVTIIYNVSMRPSGTLYKSELLSLSVPTGQQDLGIEISVSNGIVTVTVHSTAAGAPGISGAIVLIEGQSLVTDAKGKVSVSLQAGDYTAAVSAPGYKDVQVNFSVK